MRSLTVADTARGKKLREMGCIVCINEHGVFTETAIHHIDGQVKPGCHQLTIPLCGRHHQVADNDKPPRWLNFHGKKAAFERAYGTELELLEQVNGLINED